MTGKQRGRWVSGTCHSGRHNDCSWTITNQGSPLECGCHCDHPVQKAFTAKLRQALDAGVDELDRSGAT